MFPAHAGMSRPRAIVAPMRVDVPRTRGDEPFLSGVGKPSVLCSPHTRG